MGSIKEFEFKIQNELEKVVLDIINDNNILNISAKARAGAEISDFLEEKFVDYTKDSDFLHNSEGAPKEKTKNPWDARTYIDLKNGDFEEIWIDFKAFKVTSADSNPDIGTPAKIIKFIKEGGFYLIYIHVYYQEHNNGLEFVEKDGKKVKSYFLKDISSTFRRTPTNQLQVNSGAEPMYRTREEFITLLVEKLESSYQRELISIENKIKLLDINDLLEKNRNSEGLLKKQIKEL